MLKIFLDQGDCSDISSSDDSDISSVQRTFTITFSAEEWNNIKPVTNICKRKRKGVVIGDRPYLTLKPCQWTNTVFEHFHLHTRLPCRITFERN